ncbi:MULTISPECIES: PDR/VanB family oxidoreductase [unclassified Pseudomonas]|jgi:vanillate O-demethylase ferredoxin subunit|uniref:PDR/VanB family oxidoreductase n=1 Tax=unclassified Pseudomonas TaxID=196821 RepID=UPI00069E74D1|nr:MULTISPECIES: PDR/VanB family oxidoreductase [unclassified Pseudomonas]WPN44676.1 PDR/VanB family oxidoreductase [Pseudomonas sp. P8_241]
MIEVVVTSRNNEALDICSYELTCAQGGTLPAFTAGAHIDVHLPGGLVRQYSLCNHPRERNRYQIGVLKDAASRGGSQCMHEQINNGDRLHISEPRNLFPLAGDARRSLLFAGGIGITPILCMAEQLADSGADFELHYCVRAIDRAAFVERLKGSSFSDRVHLHFDEDADSRLDAAKVLSNPGPDLHLYVCGPSGFMQFVLDSAKAQGWSDGQLHREYFAAAPVDTSSDGSFQVKLGSSGQVFDIPADKTVVQVLESHGVEIAISCEQGVCGTCLTRVLEGVPDHRDLFLTDEEQAANDQFTPCCSRAKSALLVLDI